MELNGCYRTKMHLLSLFWLLDSYIYIHNSILQADYEYYYAYILHSKYSCSMHANTVQFNYNFTHAWYSIPCRFLHVKFKRMPYELLFPPDETRCVTSRNDTWHLFETCHYTRRGCGSSHITGSTTISDCTSQYNPCMTEVTYVWYRPTILPTRFIPRMFQRGDRNNHACTFKFTCA